MSSVTNQQKGCTAVNEITARYNVSCKAKREITILLVKIKRTYDSAKKNLSVWLRQNHLVQKRVSQK